MAQDFSENARPMNTKNAVKKDSKKLYPRDMVTVYSTSVLASAGIPVGTEMVIHSNLAKKMLAQNKVTETQPAESKKTVKEDSKK